MSPRIVRLNSGANRHKGRCPEGFERSCSQYLRRLTVRNFEREEPSFLRTRIRIKLNASKGETPCVPHVSQP